MKKSNVLIFVMCLGISVTGFSQAKELDKFYKGIWSKKTEMQKMYCTEHFWDNEYGQTGKDFAQQAMENSWSWERRDMQSNGDRVVFHALKSAGGGKAAEKIYFYMVKDASGEGWLIDGIDNDENHIDIFLQGKIGGHFEPEHLPEHEVLHAFGDMLIKYANGEDVPISDFMTGEYEEYIDLVKDVEDVEVEKARYSESMDKGAIHFLHMFYEDHEDLTIYFHFKDGKWEPYTYSYHAPHSKDFYMDKIDE